MTNRRRVERGFSLIEILVCLALMLALGSALFYLFAGKNGGGTKPGDDTHTPLGRAESIACKENLRQVRMAIQMEHDSNEDGKFPASLDQLKEVRSISQCPDPPGHEPYQYDPATGQVHCVHPGHENY